MNNSTETRLNVPPVHLFSDYIEIVYLLSVLIIGIPINVYILIKLFRDRRQSPDHFIKANFLLLNINLNVTDLLILLIVAFGKLCWIITYSWCGGEFLCKMFNFLYAFALYISSNIVVCIALDRLRNVIAISRIRSGKRIRTVKWSIITSWILAVVWSLPQLLVWKTINVYPDYPGGWIQCSDIWSIERYKNSVQHGETTQKLYNISHLVLAFWGPLVVMMISYIFIAVRLLQYSITSPCKKVNVVLYSNVPLVLGTVKRPKVPVWRRQLRSRVFRTTLLVVITHITFWFPYNLYSILRYIDVQLYEQISDHANIFKDLQIVIAVVNPFLYGFSN
uniref:G_PROTEIN_RECEP_F1_2 domain-containing protein n=1 Tax=Syphacia muris TaxID=451379 RepID=A0A0N5ABQ6_9BILA